MNSERSQIHENFRTAALCLILTAVTLLAFRGIHKAGFVSFDDPLYVTLNPHVQSGLTLEGAAWALTSFENFNWHPLTWISYMTDVQFFGVNSAAHHLVNLFIHVLNAVILFIVLFRMTGRRFLSFLTAALFAVHPIHVEPVAWIAQRKDVLSTFFMFLAMGAYHSQWNNKNPQTARALVYLFFALGISAKSMLVTFPVLLILLDYWPLERFRNNPLSSIILEKIPFFMISAAVCFLTFQAQYQGGSVVPLEVFSVGSRVVQSVTAYSVYLLKTVWPFGLAVFYPYEAPDGVLLIVMSVFLLIVTVAAIYLRKSHPFFLTGWFWYVIGLLPVIGLIQIGTQAMADRYTYVPLTGVFIAVLWGIDGLTREWKSAAKNAVWAIGAGVLLWVCVMLTSRQAAVWQNSVTLFEHAISVTRNNAKMYHNLGLYWAQEKDYEKAVEYYAQAIRVNPSEAVLTWYLNLGNRLLAAGGADDAAACYRAVLRVRPDFPQAVQMLESVTSEAHPSV